MNLRRAILNEVEMLNRLAIESEGIWGEDQAYMEAFTNLYKVTNQMVREEHVYILEDQKKLIGFFALLKHEEIYELELFYIKKELIGKGYGTKLWLQMIEFCRKTNIEKIELVGSDDVFNFYKKVGAKDVERIKSILQEERVVTRFEVKI